MRKVLKLDSEEIHTISTFWSKLFYYLKENIIFISVIYKAFYTKKKKLPQITFNKNQ